MSLASLLTETIDIERGETAAASATNLGGHAVSWTVQYNDIPSSRPQQPGGRIPILAMQRKMEVDNVFYLSTPVTVRTGDRISYGGLYYTVQFAVDEGGQGRVYSIATLLKS